MGGVFLKTYTPPPISRAEILRYAGVRGEAPELLPLLEDCLGEAEGVLRYTLCYSTFPLVWESEGLDLGFARTASADLAKNLAGCESVVAVAATVGIGLDRLIARYGTQSPARALLLDAIGAERIEALCERFVLDLADDLACEGKCLRPRFSPGYGDLPLALQKDIFAALDCPRRIGLSLNESLLMSPSKSVTALIGVAAKTGE